MLAVYCSQNNKHLEVTEQKKIHPILFFSLDSNANEFQCVVVMTSADLTITLKREFDVTQSTAVFQQIGSCVRQDVERLGGFQEKLQF